jgi:hypothetical protein
MYRRAKHAVICWTRAALFELALAQIFIGIGLWLKAYLPAGDEPPIVLAMSALALVFSGLTTAAVAAIDENGSNS